MFFKISEEIDRLSNHLEDLGLLNESIKLDAISNTLDKLAAEAAPAVTTPAGVPQTTPTEEKPSKARQFGRNVGQAIRQKWEDIKSIPGQISEGWQAGKQYKKDPQSFGLRERLDPTTDPLYIRSEEEKTEPASEAKSTPEAKPDPVKAPTTPTPQPAPDVSKAPAAPSAQPAPATPSSAPATPQPKAAPAKPTVAPITPQQEIPPFDPRAQASPRTQVSPRTQQRHDKVLWQAAEVLNKPGNLNAIWKRMPNVRPALINTLLSDRGSRKFIMDIINAQYPSAKRTKPAAPAPAAVTKMAFILDEVANTLQNKGYIKEAYDIDVLCNTIEKIAAGMYDFSVTPEGSLHSAENEINKIEKQIKDIRPDLTKYSAQDWMGGNRRLMLSHPEGGTLTVTFNPNNKKWSVSSRTSTPMSETLTKEQVMDTLLRRASS